MFKQFIVSSLYAGLFMGLVVGMCVFAAPIHAKESSKNAAKQIYFDYAQSGTSYQLARIALRDTILPIEDQINRRLVLFTSKTDLNGDNNPEIIVKLSDKTFFCSEEEGCKTYILSISNKGPYIIGEFSADDIFITDEKHNRVNNLEIRTSYSKEKKTLVWENGKFIEQSDEPSNGES